MDLLKNVLKLSRDKYLHEKEKGEMGFATSVDQLQFESAYLADSSRCNYARISLQKFNQKPKLFLGTDINLVWSLQTN